jgi:hypothetical protein
MWTPGKKDQEGLKVASPDQKRKMEYLSKRPRARCKVQEDGDRRLEKI